MRKVSWIGFAVSVALMSLAAFGQSSKNDGGNWEVQSVTTPQLSVSANAYIRSLLVTNNATVGSLTVTTNVTVGGVNNTTALTVNAGSVTGSGTTSAEIHTATANTSGNIDGVWKFALTDTASGSSTFHTKWLGGAAGTTELANLDKNGVLTVSGAVRSPLLSTSGANTTFLHDSLGLYLSASKTINWRSDDASGAADVIVGRDSDATMQMGIDAATATDQTLKAHDGSGTDKDGADLRLQGGQGTGTGRGGALVARTSPSSTTGSSANAYSERAHWIPKAVTLTESTATSVCTIAVPASKYVGGTVTLTVLASDATDFQARTLTFPFSAINKAGTVTAAIGTPVESIATSTGTLTATITAVANGNAVDLKVDATSSLTQTTLNATVAIPAINSNDTAAVTEI